VVLAVNAAAHGRFQEAREHLQRAVTEDSADVSALELLSDIELLDRVLDSRGALPRASPNTAVDLAKLVLELDPRRHRSYSRLFKVYADAAGSFPPFFFSFDRSETPPYEASETDRYLVAVLRDSIVMMDPESLASLPTDSQATYHQAALAAARGWVERWLEAAPQAAEAHLAASFIQELAGAPDSALAEVAVAESLGIESSGLQHQARRLVLLVRARRDRDAFRLADRIETLNLSELRADGLNLVYFLRAAGHLFNLYLIHNRAADAERLAGLVGRMTGGEVGAVAVSMGRLQPPLRGFAAPAALRLQAAESLLAISARSPPGGVLGRQLGLVMLLAQSDAGPAERARHWSRVTEVAEAFAARGDLDNALILAGLAAEHDSLQRVRLDGVAWYRALDTLRATRRETRRRMSPAAAEVTAEAAVFEWNVEGAQSLSWNRQGERPQAVEHGWGVLFQARGRSYVAVVWQQKRSGPRNGDLSDLVEDALLREVARVEVEGQFWRRTGDRLDLRTERTPRGFRMVVTDRNLVSALLAERPATVHFRFRPCEPEPGEPPGGCDFRVPVTYP
jgi:tetratricopeptide (TPR) repeat protein